MTIEGEETERREDVEKMKMKRIRGEEKSKEKTETSQSFLRSWDL